MKPAAIFLDFDGPLINWRSNLADAGSLDLIAAKIIVNCCRRLRVAGIDVMIVVSSSHRASGYDHCANILSQRDDANLLDYVSPKNWCIEGPDWHPEGGSPRARADAIKSYLVKHDIESHRAIAIDDYNLRPYLPATMPQSIANSEGLPYHELQRIIDWCNNVRLNND